MSFAESHLRAERKTAARALLLAPMLGAENEAFPLVRKHLEWLRQWFTRNTGWRLHANADFARLYKTPSPLDDPTRGLRDVGKREPFTRGRYALLCLALAVLERSERQTALGRMAEGIADLVAADPSLETCGLHFDLRERGSRTDLVAVVRALLEMRILTRVHGDEQQFISDRRDVLYNVDRPRLGSVLSVQRGPSTVNAETPHERLRQITEEVWADSDDARNQRIRHHLTRILVDDPVLHTDALSDDERAYYTSQAPHLADRVTEATGLLPERRAEGIAMVDADETLTDLGVPEEGTDGHVTLLLAEYLAQRIREQTGTVVSIAALEQHTAALATRYRTHWRKEAAMPGAEKGLCRQAVARLEALGLARVVPDGVQPRPAIARYAVTEVKR